MGGFQFNPIPKTPVEQWKSHQLLQWCYEQLSELPTQGTLKCDKQDEYFVFEFAALNQVPIKVMAIDICTALLMFYRELEKKNDTENSST